MQDINNYIKENDTDNVILNKLKELGTKLTGQENVQGETVADVLDFINSNYSGGESGNSSSDEQTAIVISDMENGTSNFYGCLERLNSMNRFTIFYNQQIQCSVTTTLTNGKLQIGTVTNEGFEGVIYLSGYAPCCYRVANDNTEYGGLLQFIGDNIYLIPSKEFAEETTDLTVYCGGSTLQFDEYPD